MGIRFVWLPVLLTACASSAGSDGTDVGGARRSIIHGEREHDLPEVVAVLHVDDSGRRRHCSGTVIGEHAVLTAKHCVYRPEDGGEWSSIPASELQVLVGHDITRAAGVEAAFEVDQVRAPEGDDILSDARNGNDIAGLLVAEPLGTPARRAVSDGPDVGTEVTIVGFGVTRTSGDDEGGKKHRGVADVTGGDEDLFETTGETWPCRGDSGGPAFDGSGAVAGIISFGPMGCDSSESVYTRVAKHAALVEELLAYPPCEPEEETCDGADNDCDGIVDEGCFGLGDECERDAHCEHARCGDVEGTRRCVTPCDPRRASDECPEGFFCEPVACGEGRCIRSELGTLDHGATCVRHTDCASGRCAELAGDRRCARQCEPGDEPCPDGEVCDVEAGACPSCLPHPLSSAPRPFGAPCAAAADCASGLCGGAYCTRVCDEGERCPDGYTCAGGRCARSPAVADGGMAPPRTPAGGGCAVGGSRVPIAWPMVLLIAAARLRRCLSRAWGER